MGNAMAGETLVSAGTMDKAMIVSLFIGLPPFSPLIPKYTSEKAQKHCVLTLLAAGCNALPAALHSNYAREKSTRARATSKSSGTSAHPARLDRVNAQGDVHFNYFTLCN
jgi:hypothetical protein